MGFYIKVNNEDIYNNILNFKKDLDITGVFLDFPDLDKIRNHLINLNILEHDLEQHFALKRLGYVMMALDYGVSIEISFEGEKITNGKFIVEALKHYPNIVKYYKDKVRDPNEDIDNAIYNYKNAQFFEKIIDWMNG